MSNETTQLPYLGYGLGLRVSHYPYIFEHKPKVDWFEVISENFMDTDGRPRRNLERILQDYPVILHGVSMSIGTIDPLSSEYLTKLKALIEWVKPKWISDHLCWTGVAHKNTHDLLPVPYTEEALRHIVERIKAVQDFLEMPIALENPSTYLEFQTSYIPEAEFIARMAEESGCNLLLDVNNVYVSCYNHRLDPKAYIDALPLDKVIQIHLSGHTNKGTHIIDTHDDHVIDEVWALYKYVLDEAGRVPNTMIEWDDNIPEFPVLAAELDKARRVAKDVEAKPLPKLAQPSHVSTRNAPVSLPEAQNLMQDAIMLGRAFDSDPDSWIRPKENFDPSAQLGVYINAYRYRLNDVVAGDYPALKHYLGEKDFDALIWGFVNTAQPDHFNIGRFSLQLQDYLEQLRPDDKFAHELCALETDIAQIADWPETPPLSQDHLVGMTPEKLMTSVLRPRGALKLAHYSYPVNAYYNSVMADENPHAPKPKATYLAVFRHEDVVWRMELGAEEYQLLTQLFDGVQIGQALETLDESAAAELTSWFSRWIRNGLLAAETNDNQPQYEGEQYVAS